MPVRPRDALEEAALYLRRRGFVLVRLGTGLYQCDRTALRAVQLLAKAEAVRQRLRVLKAQANGKHRR